MVTTDGGQAVQVQVFSAGVEDEVVKVWYPELAEAGTLRQRNGGDGLGDFDVQRFKVGGWVGALRDAKLLANRSWWGWGGPIPGLSRLVGRCGRVLPLFSFFGSMRKPDRFVHSFRRTPVRPQQQAVILSTSRLQARRTLRALGQVPGARIRHLQEEEEEEDGVVEGPGAGVEGELQDPMGWGQTIAEYLRGPAVGAGGVRAAAVGFERSIYIPPYETEVGA